MDSVVITARVSWDSGKYIAKVDLLPLEGTGESVQQAQDELIQAMRAWIELNDSTDSLGQALADVGLTGVAEDTELQLEFLE